MAEMPKTELQIALAKATQTNKRTAALFLDTLSNLAYKEVKKERRVRFARLWQAREAKEESANRQRFNDTAYLIQRVPVYDVSSYEITCLKTSHGWARDSRASTR